MHQVGTSSLLIYMMHGHTYIKLHIHVTVSRRTDTQSMQNCYKAMLFWRSWSTGYNITFSMLQKFKIHVVWKALCATEHLEQWFPTWGTYTPRTFRGTWKKLNNGRKRHIRQQCKTRCKSKVVRLICYINYKHFVNMKGTNLMWFWPCIIINMWK